MSEYSIPEKQTLVFPLFGEKPGTHLSPLPSFVLSMCLCGFCAHMDTKTLCSLVTLSCLISQSYSSVNSKAPDFREGLKLLFWPLPKVLNMNWELALSIPSCTFSFVSEFSDSPLLVYEPLVPPSCSSDHPVLLQSLSLHLCLKWWIPSRNHHLDLCRVLQSNKSLCIVEVTLFSICIFSEWCLVLAVE